MGDLYNLVPGLLGQLHEEQTNLHSEVGHASPEAKAGGEHEGPSFAGLFFYFALTIILIFGLLSAAKKGWTGRTFKGLLANSSEQLYLYIRNLCTGTIGAHGERYIPMVITFWMVIFFSNLISLFAPAAPTADLSFNLGLALIAIGYVQWEGIKTNGFVGHFSHFAGPKLGGPLVLISAMIFVIELISEFMKNVSLSLRLFGNIHGGHQAVEAMNKLGEGIYVPFGAFLLPVKLLTCVVQAMIFCLLFCVYLSLVTHHEEHGEEGHGDLHHAPAHA